ncbi:unnamed protein product [Dracunculus medinensis]|uniref:histone acetyltransferase n=1 Tax=Dracunculus medinensis TaxID=318479 RepID=A0A0N4U772_DRAME|nr:unnamed protein product [Dracunculus medinensis]
MKGDVPLVAKSPPTEPEASLPEPGTMNVLDEIPKDEPLYTEEIQLSSYEFEQSKQNINVKQSVRPQRKKLNKSRRRIFYNRRKSKNKKSAEEVDVKEDLPRLKLTIGLYEMNTWYNSSIPSEIASNQHLFVCEKCLNFKASAEALQRHLRKCIEVYPPGNEIFRQGQLSIFEVDGEISKNYCQNLCTVAKLFIDHKTLLYDVEPFLFYVATLSDSYGCHIEKFSAQKNNLSCLLTFPCYHKRGIGRFLIDFSFLLSRKEKLLGTPEKPLSELGRVAYRSYWRAAILEFFHSFVESKNQSISIHDVAEYTGISYIDVIQTLSDMQMLEIEDDSVSLILNTSLMQSYRESVKKDETRIWIDENNLKAMGTEGFYESKWRYGPIMKRSLSHFFCTG